MNVAEARSQLQARLREFLGSRAAAASDGRPTGPIDEEASLIRSGFVDSLALVDLLLWIETETGGPLDAAVIEGIKRADTPKAIVDLILAGHGGAMPCQPTSKQPEDPPSRFQADIVAYRSQLRDQVLALQLNHWGENRRLNDAYFRWKYEQNPYLRKPLIYLMRVAGRLVGMRGFYGAEWEIGRGQRLRTVCAGDLVFDPAYRNRGLVRRLMQQAMVDLKARGYRYLFSLSAGVTTHISSLPLGWRGIGSMEPLSRRGPGLAAQASCFERFDAIAARQHGRVRWNPPDLRAMAELVARIGANGRIRHVRTLEYFAWRLGNPRSTYRVLTWRRERVEGYMILQTSTYRRGAVRIVDWEGTTTPVKAALLRAAIEWGDFDELTTWSATLPDESRRLLRETGFIQAPPRSELLTAAQPTVLIKDLAEAEPEFRPWTLGGQDVLCLARWDLRMLYSDAV